MGIRAAGVAFNHAVTGPPQHSPSLSPPGDEVVEGGPAAAAVELGLGRVQRLAAATAAEHGVQARRVPIKQSNTCSTRHPWRDNSWLRGTQSAVCTPSNQRCAAPRLCAAQCAAPAHQTNMPSSGYILLYSPAARAEAAKRQPG